VRILHVTADWKWTGPAEPMLHAVTALRERGHHVDLACAPTIAGHAGALPERARERGVEPAHWFARRQGYVPVRDAGEVRRLRAFVRAGRYDVVHAHHTRDHLLCRRALGSRGSAPKLVFSWHHGDPLPRSWWAPWLLGPKGNDGLVCLSESIARSAREGMGWPAERVAVVPGAVDSERFAPAEPDTALRAELGLEPSHRVVGVVARLQPHRRFDLLLEAFARALASAPELRLVVVGRGTRAREVLEEPVERMGLGHAVIRAGYRSTDYAALLALLDALVFLVPGSDGSCRAVLEAMATGVPVIASHRGVLPETVSGETGAIVDEEPAALAAAFLDVARDPGAWKARGEAARRSMKTERQPAAGADRLEALYATLTA
jgi:glycosyltransferase involved in cell wall biosynthesis